MLDRLASLKVPAPPVISDEASSVEGVVETEALDARTLYVHTKRPAWGWAIVVRRYEGGTEYQFQDGQMRRIAGDYQHLMQAVDRPADESAEVSRQLRAMSGLALAARNARRRDDDERALYSLDDQVAVFLEDYPGGFDDPRWVRGVRGEGATRRLKRHREPAIAQAQSSLAVDSLDEQLARMDHEAMLDRALGVLKDTSLVTNAQLGPLQAASAHQQALLAEALRELLWGRESHELRFLRLLRALTASGCAPSWPLATVWPALVFPREHVCVRTIVFREQARWMAPNLTLSNDANAAQYQRLQRMTLSIREALLLRELKPRDLLDVHDFIWATLRPAARQRLEQRAPTAPSSGVSASSAAQDGDGEADAA